MKMESKDLRKNMLHLTGKRYISHKQECYKHFQIFYFDVMVCQRICSFDLPFSYRHQFVWLLKYRVSSCQSVPKIIEGRNLWKEVGERL